MRIIMKKYIVFSLFFTLFTVIPAITALAQDVQQGNASWYEDDSLDLKASHARFPPGTRLRVTNMNNQKEVYVTVTNRIQNSDVRILDISQEAATLLGMNETGTTPIRLEVIRGLTAEPAPPAPETSGYTDKPAAYTNEDDYEDEYVPEITAVAVSDDNEDYYTEEVSPITAAPVGTPASPPPPLRVYPQQSASQSQPAAAQPAVQPAAESQVLLKKIVVLINGREQTIDIPDGVYIPLPATGQGSPAPAYSQPVYTPPSRPAPVQAAPPGIKLIPKLPDPNSGKVYRVQVGAFSRVALAQVCFDRLKTAGFTPSYEQNGSLYRVVISGIKAADVSYAAQRLTAAGFTEAWIREESRR
jgi:cell division septation protein DedD